ncbi:acetolactate decarboxylase, partial [Staphylococcus aureus]|uniref:acetolactate decarboxylase n=1 Tax=Staphylococcus aureus TaxID=1280 RepID=UPI0037DA0C57
MPTLTPSHPQLIFLHPNPYHPNHHKQFIQLKRDHKLPYPSITNFTPTNTFPFQQLSQHHLFPQIKNQMLTHNLFSPLKIYPTFKHIHLRIIPPHQPPYTPFIHSPPRQPQEKTQHIPPPILGFFTPEL